MYGVYRARTTNWWSLFICLVDFPSAPEDLNVIVHGARNVSLTWSQTARGEIECYRFRCEILGALGPSIVGTTTNNEPLVEITAIQPNTEYECKIDGKLRMMKQNRLYTDFATTNPFKTPNEVTKAPGKVTFWCYCRLNNIFPMLSRAYKLMTSYCVAC